MVILKWKLVWFYHWHCLTLALYHISTLSGGLDDIKSPRRSFHHSSNSWECAGQDFQEDLRGGAERDKDINGSVRERREEPRARAWLLSARPEHKRALQEREVFPLQYCTSWNMQKKRPWLWDWMSDLWSAHQNMLESRARICTWEAPSMLTMWTRREATLLFGLEAHCGKAWRCDGSANIYSLQNGTGEILLKCSKKEGWRGCKDLSSGSRHKNE